MTKFEMALREIGAEIMDVDDYEDEYDMLGYSVYIPVTFEEPLMRTTLTQKIDASVCTEALLNAERQERAQITREIHESLDHMRYMAEYYAELIRDELEAENAPKKRGRGERRKNTFKAKQRHRRTLISTGFDQDYDEVGYGYRLSEIFGASAGAWKKYAHQPKKVRNNPDLTGKSNAYRKVNRVW